MSQTEVPPLPPTVFPERHGGKVAEDAPAPRLAGIARGVLGLTAAVMGWLYRWAVGALMCFNVFVLSWFTSVAAVGWTNRVVQASVLRAWWWRSPKRHDSSFSAFCDSLGPDAPVARPRWFFQERPLAHLYQPVPTGLPTSGSVFWQVLCWMRLWFQQTLGVQLVRDGKPGPLALVGRVLCWPLHSLWLNFKLGALASLCTFALVGFPCLLTCWSWEQGWINSFHGGYEQAPLGASLGFFGIFVFSGVMMYVPMAQTHQAVTGKARAFFEFRFVWMLVKARLSLYLLLALAIGFWSLMLTIGSKSVLTEAFAGNRAPNPEEGLLAFQRYLLMLSALMFPVYVALRLFAGVVYQSAVLKVLRQGKISHEELHPVLRSWLDALDLRVTPRAETVGIGWVARLLVSTAYRRALLVLLFVAWFLFMVRFYVGTFFVYDPYVGFLNHPLIQIPCFDFIPLHLYQGHEF